MLVQRQDQRHPRQLQLHQKLAIFFGGGRQLQLHHQKLAIFFRGGFHQSLSFIIKHFLLQSDYFQSFRTTQFQFSIFVAGFLGNFLCVICFSLKKGKRNFHYLMMSLAVFDILYIYSATVLFTVPHLLPRSVCLER